MLFSHSSLCCNDLMSTSDPGDESKKMAKRSSIRYQPDEGTFALIDCDADAKTFNPTLPALVFSEAHKGCGLVALTSDHLQVGRILRVQVGSLAPLRSEIRWREQLDPNVIKIGIMFLE